MVDLEAAREEMIEWHLKRRGIRDARVLAAMRAVPREEFVPAALAAEAYSDHPLPIGAGQTISQPYVVALMMQGARIGPSDRLLDVGTGSGYAAAVASQLAGEVWSIERVTALAERARQLFERLAISKVHVEIGDGTQGLAAHAPFDVILVAASAPDLPTPLLNQLAEGGRLIIPIASARFSQDLVLVTRTGDTKHRTSLGAVTFVPLIGEHGWSDPS